MKKLLAAAIAMILIASNASSVGIMPPPKTYIPDNAGKPCVGCKVCVYESGTTTPKASYTDSTGGTANANPVVAGSRGEVSIWYSGTAKLKVMAAAQTSCSTGTALYTQDSVPAVESLTFSNSEWTDTTPTSWVYISGTSFSISGDKRTEFQVGRRLKATSSGIIYGRITDSTYSSPNTTVTVAWDSGSLNSGGITAMQISTATVTNPSLSADMISSGTTSANITFTGTATHSGAVNISGTTTLTGATTLTASGSLDVAGTTTFTGAVIATGATPASWTGTYNFAGTTNHTGQVNFNTGSNTITNTNSLWDSWPRSTTATKTASYAVATSDYGTTLIASAAVPVTFTLPAATAPNGTQIVFKNIATPVATISGTIDGTVNPTLAGPNASTTIFNDGTAWRFRDRNTTLPVSTIATDYTITAGDHGRTLVTSTTPTVVTITLATPAVFTATSHGLVAGNEVAFTTTATLPTGVSSGTSYYVIVGGLTANDFEVATAAGGTAINTASPQSGVHSVDRRLTVTLPATAAVPTGFNVDLKNSSAQRITIAGTVDGIANGTMLQYDGKSLFSDGSNWRHKYLTRNLAMTGEASTTATTLDLGTVTAGDRIAVTWSCKVTQDSANSETDLHILKSSGTATMIFQNGQASIGQSIKTDYSVRGTNAAYITVNGVIQVTGSGTLVIGRNIVSYGTAPTVSAAEGYVYFLNKQ